MRKGLTQPMTDFMNEGLALVLGSLIDEGVSHKSVERQLNSVLPEFVCLEIDVFTPLGKRAYTAR